MKTISRMRLRVEDLRRRLSKLVLIRPLGIPQPRKCGEPLRQRAHLLLVLSGSSARQNACFYRSSRALFASDCCSALFILEAQRLSATARATGKA